jgi:hypothetical protein
MAHDIRTRSLRLLEPWVAQARRHFHQLAGTDSVCYGLGHRGHWAVQAHDTAFSALAVLAADPQTDSLKADMSRDEMLDTARAMFRFTFRSHHAGGGGFNGR